jgi:hypothetical protein
MAEIPGLVNLSNPSLIYVMCKACFGCYHSLCDALQDAAEEEASQNGFDRDYSLAVMQDARSKFKAWAVGIAAIQEGHLRSSLDFRLQTASEIRKRILTVLENLKESLHDGQSNLAQWSGGVLTCRSFIDCFLR